MTPRRAVAMEKESAEDVVATIDGLAPLGPVALALIDLDGFGTLNDEVGRDAADALLRGFERLVGGSLPNRDGVITFSRIGGDEYAVVADGATAETLLILMEEVRAHAATKALDPDLGRGIQMSIGIAAMPPHAATGAELYRAAHHALFRAKRDGGGRVAIYVEEKMVLKSNYYEPAMLHRLSRLSTRTGRTEASLLREALDDLLAKHAD